MRLLACVLSGPHAAAVAKPHSWGPGAETRSEDTKYRPKNEMQVEEGRMNFLIFIMAVCDLQHSSKRCLSDVMEYFISVAGPSAKAMRNNTHAKMSSSGMPGSGVTGWGQGSGQGSLVSKVSEAYCNAL